LSRDSIRDRIPTSLSRTTAFLYGDYEAATFWFEPLEMCRKLALTGWVLLIPDDAEHGRILLALLLSIVFLVLYAVVSPLKRCAPHAPSVARSLTHKRFRLSPSSTPFCASPILRMDDRALMTMIQLSLVLVYTSCLVIKTCDVSADACAMFGFGATSKGDANAAPLQSCSLPSRC
jgi:hypothetical protein